MRVRRLLAAIRKFCSNRIFSRLLVYYAVLVALFATVCVVSYYQAMHMSVEHTIDRNRIIFENSAATLRSAGESMDALTATLSGPSAATSPLRPLFSGSARTQIYDIYEVIHRLPPISDNTGLVDGYFVYMPGSDSIVAPGQGFTALSVYYKDYFALDPEQSYEEWHSDVLDCRTRSLHASWKDRSEIQYVVPLNNYYTGNVSVKIVYQINANRLLLQISTAFSDHLECAAITNEAGRVLAIDRGDETVVDAIEQLSFPDSSGTMDFLQDGAKYMLSYSAVSDLGARLIILLPYSVLNVQAFDTIRGLLAVFTGLLLAGLALMLVILVSWMAPLMRIADRITDTDAKGSGLWLVSDAFARMERSNAVLEKYIEEQKGHLRNACINRLIHGDGSDPYSLEELLSHSELPIRGNHYRGVLIELCDAQPEDLSRVRILELLRQYSEHLIFLTFERLDVIACLYSRSDEDSLNAREFFTHAYEALKPACGLDVMIYVGFPTDCLEQIADSFSSASWLMSVSQHNEWLCIAEDNPPGLSLQSILSTDTEKKLENLVMTGEKEAALALLDEIYRRNFVENHLQGFSRQFLYCRLVGLLASCNADLTDENSLPSQLLQLGSREFFKWIDEQLALCCDRACTRSSLRSQRLIDDACAYIEDNFSNYELALNSLAFRLGITGNYLSGLFKKQLGMNFSVYVEQVRIRHAEELLLETAATIDEIAQQVGYTNSDSFRRAFRRVRGVSPSGFRASVEKDAL